jgi:hypothetical protein
MLPRSVDFLLVCLTMLCGCALLAQSRSYHMELSDGTSGWGILVNDSQKTIEAYHFSAKCRGVRPGESGLELSYDALDFDGTVIGFQGPGGLVTQRDVSEPGARIAVQQLLPQPSCEWKADINAVLYADGSYEGDEMSARGLQARRDGIAASVKYWTDRLSQESAGKPNLEATHTDAERLTQEDEKKAHMFPGCGKLPLTCQYWRGRSHVDRSVALKAKSQKDGSEGSYRRIVQFVTRWEKKIEADVALKKLDAVFPLAAALAEERKTIPGTAGLP